jgi:hypothetical protein
MNNSKILLILSCFCVLSFSCLSCIYHENKQKRRNEYQKIVSEAHQQIKDLKRWDNFSQSKSDDL